MTLVVMAAGMGSRYGGLKQLDPIGKNGEYIIDYSVYDAIKAGFDKVVFIIKEENYEIFDETIGQRIKPFIKVEYAFQAMDTLPEFVNIPKDRVKPWGTAHAILAAKDKVDDNFIIINADDFYGASAYETAKKFYDEPHEKSPLPFMMVGYILKNTVSDNGSVARGVCVTNGDKLIRLDERLKIEKHGEKIEYTEDDKWYDLDVNGVVSMNMFGFTPDIFPLLEEEMDKFFKKNQDNLAKCEFLIPVVVSDLVNSGVATVSVLPTQEKWYGVTYREDKPHLVNAVNELIQKGAYKENLWG